MKIHQFSVEDALGSLGTTADGLSSSEALHRLRQHGPKRVEKIARTPAGLRLLREFVQFFPVIRPLAAGRLAIAGLLGSKGLTRIGSLAR